MTNNTTADTTASGAGEAFVEAWLVGNDESGPYVLRRKSTGWLYEVPLVRKSAHDTLRAQLEAAEAECARISEAIDLAFDASAADLEANKAEYEFNRINGAYYGLVLLRVEIAKARAKARKAATP